MDAPQVEHPTASPPAVRAKLRQQLRTDADFVAFVLDHFPAVYHRISDGMDRVGKENLLFALESSDAIAVALALGKNLAPTRVTDRGNRKSRYAAICVVLASVICLGISLLWFHNEHRTPLTATIANTPSEPTSAVPLTDVSPSSSVPAVPTVSDKPKIKARTHAARPSKKTNQRSLTTSELVEELDRPPPDH